MGVGFASGDLINIMLERSGVSMLGFRLIDIVIFIVSDYGS